MPRPPEKLDAEGLYQKAVRALARAGRTELEIRRLLRTRARAGAEGAGDIQSVIARLRDHGYLDDQRLAQAVANYQKEVVRHGRGRVLRDLKARGVAPELATAAVERNYPNWEGTNEDALLRALVRKKRWKRPEDLRQAASLYRKLLLAGFSSAACQRCLRAWRVDAEWLEKLEQAQESIQPLEESEEQETSL